MARNLKPRVSYLHSASSIPYTGMTLCDVLDRSAEQFPDKEAFLFATETNSKRITFGQLRHDVIQLAAGLLNVGVKPGEQMGIWCENRYEWLLTQYAAAYIKVVLVRFPVTYNEEYMMKLMEKTKVSTLIIGAGNPEKVFSKILPYISLDSDDSQTNLQSNLQRVIFVQEKDGRSEEGKAIEMHQFDDIRNGITETAVERVLGIRGTVLQDDEWTIVFTSGSTGLPKAIVRTHRAGVESFHTFGRHIREVVNNDVRFMSLSPFTHVGGEFQTTMGVIFGHTVIVPDPNADARMIAALIQRERVTVAFFMFHHLFDLVNQASPGDEFSSLEILFTGGNIVPDAVLENTRKLITPNIFNHFGSSETGPTTFNFNVDKLSKIGYQTDHIEFKIIDDKGYIVPLETTGELCIRAAYVFHRYEGDEEKTKDDIDAGGWFHTGDLCSMESDGCLNVMGRKKDIIIKGGRNISPLEVERVIMKHPNVRLIQVVSVPDERLVEEICACICLGDNQEQVKAGEIIDFARCHLEDCLVPKYVLFFGSFPTIPTGKIHRKELAKEACIRLELNK